MESTLVFAAVFIWLFTAGCAFRSILEDGKTDGIIAVFLFCLLLAPFAAGAAFINEKKSPTPEKSS